MHALSIPLLVAQVSPQDVEIEMARLQRNYEFLSWGLTAAWLILVIYVLMLVSRQRKAPRDNWSGQRGESG